MSFLSAVNTLKLVFSLGVRMAEGCCHHLGRLPSWMNQFMYICSEDNTPQASTMRLEVDGMTVKFLDWLSVYLDTVGI